MFTLEMLPAHEGDALILTWGDATNPRRLLIDAGRKPTAKAVQAYVRQHKLGAGAFELFVITHIDRDHIEGAVPLLRSAPFRALVREVWFNGRADLEWHPPENEFESMGALDGERITEAIHTSGLPWNARFEGRPVAVVDEQLPSFQLPDGLILTVLSPDLRQLAALAQRWDDQVEAAPEGWENFGSDEPMMISRLAATRFERDPAKPNASSIALIAEYEGMRVLLGADAHVPRLLASLALYAGDDAERRRFVLVKTPHHGSRKNVSVELVAALECENWAISTSGAHFDHPDAEAIARIVEPRQASRLFFNYRSEQSEIWMRPTDPARGIVPLFGEGGYLAIDIANLANAPL